MGRRSPELWLAFAAIILISIVYAAAVTFTGAVPAASGWLGHGIGVVGFALMLMAETLYSLRKRAVTARWGRMATWLRLHVVFGLVGPYLVLLHTGWQFNGLAGLAMLLTVVIVASGFIGRYIYTAIPRSADGIALDADDLQHQIATAEAALQHNLADNPQAARMLAQRLEGAPAGSPFWGRFLADWRFKRAWAQQKRQLQALGVTELRQLEDLLVRRQTLQRQVASLAAARRMLAVWHTVHVPLGVTLFTVAVINIGAARYYATFLR
jgi:hypothetical protein